MAASEEPIEQVISIDFGSFGYAVAFCPLGAHKSCRMVQNWCDMRAATELKKNLSAILINKETKETVAFGYEAEEQYAKAREKQEQCEYMYFEHFKSFLYSNDSQKDVLITAVDGTSTMLLSDLIIKSLICIVEHSLGFINELNTLAGLPICSEVDNYWIVSVPAVWDSMSKELMKTCIERSGVTHFELCSECVASAFHVLSMSTQDLGNIDEMLVLDCGGCTVDGSYIRRGSREYELYEFRYGDGLRAGSLDIDSKFVRLLDELLPKHITSRVRSEQPAQWVRQKNEFVLAKLSCPLDFEGEGDYWNVPFCYGINSHLNKMRRQMRRNKDTAYKNLRKHICEFDIPDHVNRDDDHKETEPNMVSKCFALGRATLKINKNGWLYLHDDVLSKIVSFVRKLFSNKNMTQCKNIVLCGGFANSKYLGARLQAELPNKYICIARQPHLSVVKGALYWHSSRNKYRIHTVIENGVNVTGCFNQISKRISNFTLHRFKDSMKNKGHLQNLELSAAQCKTSFCLEHQALDFVFHHKSYTWSQPIAFWVSFKLLNKMLKALQYIKDFMDSLLQQPSSTKSLSDSDSKSGSDIDIDIAYKIGALKITPDRDEPLFIKGVLNTIRQTNGIEQPFHIDIELELVQSSDMSESKEMELDKQTANLSDFSAGVSLPIKAVIPSYKLLYPMEIYETPHIDQGEKYENIISVTTKYNPAVSQEHIKLNDRLSVIIPAAATKYDFKFKTYPLNTENTNDVRFEILSTDEYIKDKAKNEMGLRIKWKLDSVDKGNKFKIYFCIKPLNIWCTGNDKQTHLLNDGRPTRGNDGFCYIEADIYGAYDIHIREQTNFYDQYIDTFCLNQKFHRDFTHLPPKELRRFKRGGRPYYLPQGWKIFAVNIERNHDSDLIKTGCVGFHSTTIDILPSILRDGLVPPGTVLSSTGCRLAIPKGHITKSEVSGIDDDDFINNIFVSPSINYCTHPAYCKPFKLSSNKYVHLALKVFIKPEAIRENRHTIRWCKDENHSIDANYNNNNLEWRIRDAKDMIITGLCIHEDDGITNKQIWNVKQQMMNGNNLLHCTVRDIFDLKRVIKLTIVNESDSKYNLQIHVFPTMAIKELKVMYLDKVSLGGNVSLDSIKVYYMMPNSNTKKKIFMKDNAKLLDYGIVKSDTIHVLQSSASSLAGVFSFFK
eukprot:178741_1